MIKKKQRQQIQTHLLDWYAKYQRDLPWRRTNDSYAIWISEIMLQQTQVATAKPYYKKFLEKFPAVNTLAKAPIDDVLKAWEGLGYYSRARNMHRAAIEIVEHYNSQLPQTTEELLKLPGIGPYTAGAIASIAFGLDEPVLDGNVIRVASRLFRIHENPKETSTQKKLWGLARDLIPTGEASFFNQALMDLGATICTPKKPRCLTCPLYEVCEARQHNEQDLLPIKVKRPKTPHYDLGVGIVWKDDQFLLVQRPKEGLLGGLWEFPGGEQNDGETLEGCITRHIKEKLGVKIKVKQHITTVKHGFTHFKITVHAFACKFISGKPKPNGVEDWAWSNFEKLDNYALPKATHKVIQDLKKSITIEP